MVSLITISILLLASLALAVLRVVRPAFSYSWLIAVLGVLLAWISIFFWPMDMPRSFDLLRWTPENLYSVSPGFTVDSVAWFYSLALLSTAVAVILTAPAQSTGLSTTAWIGTLGLTILGLVAFMAANPLTLVLIWMALDLAEMANTLRLSQTAAMSEQTVVAFTTRMLGTGFMLWASVERSPLTFSSEPAFTTSLYLLLAAGLRLGVLPLHLPYGGELGLRRGLGTSLRLTAAAASLVSLARIPIRMEDPVWAVGLMCLVVLAAVYGAWKWLTASNELSGRPYWLIGMAALSIAAALRGNSAGSAAWGGALLFFGTFSFLYSARDWRYTLAFIILGLAQLGLPFTLTATIWQGDLPFLWFFWPFYLAAQIFLAVGYVRHLMRPAENVQDLPRWAQAAYPLGFIFPGLSLLVLGLWGWDGALRLGLWQPGLGGVLLSFGAFFLFRRVPRLLPVENPDSVVVERRRPSWLVLMQRAAGNLFWAVYRGLRQFFEYISNLLEGEGGLLWTLLLLVLLLSLIRGGW